MKNVYITPAIEVVRIDETETMLASSGNDNGKGNHGNHYAWDNPNNPHHGNAKEFDWDNENSIIVDP